MNNAAIRDLVTRDALEQSDQAQHAVVTGYTIKQNEQGCKITHFNWLFFFLFFLLFFFSFSVFFFFRFMQARLRYTRVKRVSSMRTTGHQCTLSLGKIGYHRVSGNKARQIIIFTQH